ncbi:translation initiation factor IF-2 N-terminal domain-containing protein, partial [Deinococcus pimensis]|uniref:translation initiation factor IF-2 N-terminal domain-containing protein n=1 Tax=Deinococcus pimensis TaxID=309888 RepID=UPI000480AEA9
MSKVRIYALAKELGLETAQLLEMLDGLGVQYKSSSSTLDEETVEAIKALVGEGSGEASAPAETEPA